MVDIVDLKSAGRKAMPVRVRQRAPFKRQFKGNAHMKKYAALIILILLIGAGAYYFTLPKNGTLHFASENEVKIWAEATFGGGFTESYAFSRDGDVYNVVVAYRSFTSGRESTDVTFFIKRYGWYVQAFHYPMVYEALEVEQSDGKFIIKKRGHGSNKDAVRRVIKFEELLQ